MNKIRFISLTASLVLAITFTLSCEDKDPNSFKDSRNGKTYRKVTIGSQIWMAENLNYEAEGSKCYDNDPTNCAKYGRLYDWETAMMVCPSGWHLPSNAEWTILTVYVDGASGISAATKLKSTSGWRYNGTDQYGFSALPGGASSLYGSSFRQVGGTGYWWTASEYGSSSDSDGMAYFQSMQPSSGLVHGGYLHKSSEWFSVRCLQD